MTEDDLYSRLHNAIQQLLPAHARFSLLFVVADEKGVVRLDNAVLQTISNVPPDVLRRFGHMLTSEPVKTIEQRAGSA